MKDHIKGFCITVFHGSQGPVQLIHGSWVDPVSHAPLPASEQKRLWQAFCQEHKIEVIQSGTGPDDGYTSLEI